MGVLSDEDLVAMRARARHRLTGALALVLLLVVGVPLLFDRRDPPPLPTDDGDSNRPAEDSHPAPPLPASVTAPGSGLGGTPAGSVAPRTSAAAPAVPAAPATSAPAGSAG